MKTINERARVEAIRRCSSSKECLTDFGVACFEDGAQWMREELIRWHDPKVELPENDREVLCIIDSWTSTFMVLKHNDLGWWMHPPHYYGWCSCCFNVLGWRNIHEHRSEKVGEK